MDEAAEIEKRLQGVPDPAAFLASMFAFAPVAIQIYRADGHSLLTNRAFRELFGSEPPPAYNVLEDDIAERNGLLHLIRQAFAGETVTTPPIWYDARELEQVKIEQGRRVFMQATFLPLRDAAGKVSNVAIVFKDLTAEKVQEERINALLQAASQLSEAASTAEMVDAIVAASMAAVGATGGSLAIVDRQANELRVVGSRGHPRHMVERFGVVPMESDLPLATAARTCQPVWISSGIELTDRFPTVAAAGQLSEGARVALPLVVQGRAIGCIGLTLPGPRNAADDERSWLEALARLCAQAYERARLSDARATDAEDAAERARFVAGASAAFSESLDLRTTLQRVADACVPRLGDLCFVDVARADGTFERVASSRSAAGVGAAVDRVEHAYPGVAGSAQPAMRAIRERVPVVVDDWSAENVRAMALDDEHARLLLSLGIQSLVAVPMIARGNVVGALSLSTSRAGERFSPERIALVQDLAHRAALSIDAARLYAEAQRAVRLREDFLSIAGHELKTPLTALFLQVQTVRRKLEKPGPDDGQRIRHSVDVAERQVKRLASLVHQLLDVSRLAAGRLALELERFDLVDLVRDVASRFADEEARGGSAIVVAADGPIEGCWDRQRVDQVLTNLLTNAVRYGQREQVDVIVGAENGVAILRVRDRGIGIALEDQGRIFERFERAAPLRNYGGVGLGLWIVKELVSALGGQVSVASEPGEGATFTVELPLDADLEKAN